MPSLVIDASVALALIMPDEAKPVDVTIGRLRTDDAVVPAIWWLEVSNTLLQAERRKRIDAQFVRQALADLGGYRIATETADDELVLPEIVALARRYGLTTYDAAYLELALRHGVPLASFDSGLRSAAKRAGVALLD